MRVSDRKTRWVSRRAPNCHRDRGTRSLPRSSLDRRSIESSVPWRRRIPRWRNRRHSPGEEARPRFLRSWDPWCGGCAGTVRAIGGAAAKCSGLRKATCLQIFLAFGFFRRFGLSRARRSTLDARRSTACLIASSPHRVFAPRIRTLSDIERYSFHANFSASRSHLSTAAAGTSPLSPPCSTHVSLGLGGGASAPSPPPALGGSPKNLMA